MRIWNDWNFHRVLKGMQNGTSTLENKLAISFKVKHTVIIQVTISSLSMGIRQMKLYLQRPVRKISWYLCFPGVSDSKESACHVGDLGLVAGLGRSPGEGKGHPLQYSCLENPMDRGAWQATVHGVIKWDTTERLSLHFTFTSQLKKETIQVLTKNEHV